MPLLALIALLATAAADRLSGGLAARYAPAYGAPDVYAVRQTSFPIEHSASPRAGRGLGDDGWRLELAGYFRPSASRLHVFCVEVDDAIRVWFNGIIRVDAIDAPHERQERCFEQELRANQFYALRLEYVDFQNEAYLDLSEGGSRISSARLHYDEIDVVVFAPISETCEYCSLTFAFSSVSSFGNLYYEITYWDCFFEDDRRRRGDENPCLLAEGETNAQDQGTFFLSGLRQDVYSLIVYDDNFDEVITTDLVIGPTVSTGAISFTTEPHQVFVENSAMRMGLQLVTYAMWVKTTDSMGVLLDKTFLEEFATMSIKDGKLDFSFGTGAGRVVCTGSTVISDGEWHYLAAVRVSQTRARVYVDGNLENDVESGGFSSLVVDNNYATLGGPYSHTTPHPLGYDPGFLTEAHIDELRLWQRALPASEIATSMALTDVSFVNLAGHFDFTDAITSVYFQPRVGAGAVSISTSFGVIAFHDEQAQAPLALSCDEACITGTCDTLRGVCACDEGFLGPGCEETYEVSPALTVADGPGLVGTNAGNIETVSIVTRDYNNEEFGEGEANLYVGVTGSDTAFTVPIEDYLDGTYDFDFELFRVGTYSLAILVRDQPISGSPFSVQVSPGEISGSNCIALNADLFAAGVPAGTTAFEIQARDLYDNDRDSGGDQFTLQVLQSSGPLSAVYRDRLDGTYAYDFTLSAVGTYSVGISLDGDAIDQSPFSLVVTAGPLDADTCEVSGPGVSGTAIAGEPTTFTIRALDSFGNPRTDGTDLFQIRAGGIDGVVVHSSDEEYLATYQLDTVGSYTVRVRTVVGANELAVSPIPLTVVPNVVEPSATFASGMPEAPVSAGSTITFFVEARDAFGNIRANPFDDFVVTYDGPNGPEAAGIALDDGIRRVTFSPEAAGEYTVNIEVDGSAIANSGFSVEVVPGAISIADSEVIALAEYPAGEFEIIVQGRDSFGNPRPFSVPFSFSVEGAGSATRSIGDDVAGNGSHIVTVQAQTLGAYTASVFVGTEALNNSPASFSVVPGRLSLANSQASGPGLSGAYRNEVMTVDVQGIDEFGNLLTERGADADITATILPSTGTSISVDAQNDGVYRIEYTKTQTGPYTLTITADGESLPGSPFSLTAVDALQATGIEPDNGPITGATLVTVLGSNMLPSVQCIVDSGTPYPSVFIASDRVACAMEAVGSPRSVDIEVAAASFVRGPFTFRYTAPVTVTRMQPTSGFVQGGTEVTIVGTNFDTASSSFACKFGDVVSTDIVSIAADEVVCETPSLPAGSTLVSVSNNGQQFVGEFPYLVSEAFSPLCRQEGELEIAIRDRLDGGYDYFPNLALSGDASLTDTGAVHSDKPSLVDGDRCCAGVQDGLCGVAFGAATDASPLAQAHVVLPGGEAFVNQMVTSWFEPCRNEPDPFLRLEYYDSDATAWRVASTRFTGPGAGIQKPCYTAPSDTGVVSICVDYFPIVRASEFRVVFNNSQTLLGSVPTESDGGWIYELEVHGVYIGSAYALNAEPWSGGSTLASQVATPLPATTVTSAGLLGASLVGTDPDSHIVTAALYRVGAEGGEWTPVTDQYLRGTLTATMTGGEVVFDSLELERPVNGQYELVFTAPSLQPTTLPLEIAVGQAVDLRLVTANDLTVSAQASSPIGVVRMRGYDAGETWVQGFAQQDAQDVSVTVLGGGATLAGTTTRPLLDGVVDFDDLALVTPQAGIYELSFTGPGLDEEIVEVEVVVGEPVQLMFVSTTSISAPTRSSFTLPEVRLVALDAGGNEVGDTDLEQRTIVAETTFAPLEGTVLRTMINGKVVFDDLVLRAPTQGTGTIAFRSASRRLQEVEFSVEVLIGEPVELRVASGPISAPLAAVAETALPDVSLEAYDASGAFVGAVDQFTRDIEITAELVELSPLAGVGPSGRTTLGGTTAGLLVEGAATISGTTLVAPQAGVYELSFSVAGLTPTQVELTVEPGPAVAMLVDGDATPSDLSFASVVSVAIQPPIQLLAVDAGGNFAVGEAGVVVVSSSTTALGGTQSVSFSGGVAVFSELTLVRPSSGLVELSFASGQLESLEGPFNVEVVDGPPLALQIVGSAETSGPSVVRFVLPTIELEAIDAGGAAVPVAVGATAVLTVEDILETSVDFVGGRAVFEGVTLDSPRRGQYNVTLSSLGLEPAAYTLTVTAGPPQRLSVVSAALRNEDADALVVEAAFNSPLGEVVVAVTDAGGGAIEEGALIPPFTVTAQSDGGLLTLENPVADSDEDGRAVLTDLRVSQPPVGRYRIVFTGAFQSDAQQFESAFIDLVVTVGPPRRMRVSEPESSNHDVVAAARVTLPPVVLDLLDETGNFIGNATTLTEPVVVSVSSDTVSLTSPSIMTVGARARFTGVELLAPTAMTHQVRFEAQVGASGPVLAQTMTVTVSAGEVAQLGLGGPITSVYPNEGPLLVQPKIETQDLVGNRVPLAGVIVQATVSANEDTCPPEEDTGCGPFPEEAFRAVTSADGIAEFGDDSDSAIGFLGVHGVTYTISFVSASPEYSNLVPTLFPNVTVIPCQVANTAPRGPECLCKRGFTGTSAGTCLECPSNTYKDEVGQQACRACPANTQSALRGLTSVQECACAPDFFSLEPGGECLKCPVGGVCPGGTVLEADVGYWRDDPDSIVFAECTGFACEGGLNSNCSVGHTGPLCAVCQEGYGGFGTACEPCPAASLNWFLLSLLGLALLLVLVFLVKTATGPKSMASMTAKILVGFFQSTAFLAGFSTPWPQGLQRVFEYFAVSTLSANILSVSCAFKLSYYQYLTYYLVMPLVAVGIVGLFFLSVYAVMLAFGRLRDKARATEVRSKLFSTFVVTMLIVVFLSHPAITKQVFEVFNCVKVLDRHFLASDMRIECYTSTHNFWTAMAALMLVLYCLGLPIAGALALFKFRYRLREPKVQAVFRFLYDGYAPKRFFWEPVVMLRKLALVGILVFARDAPVVQIVTAAALFTFCLWAHLRFRPYELSIHRQLEFVSLMTTFTTVQLGGLFLGAQISPGVEILLNVVLVTINTAVIAIFVLLIAVALLPVDKREAIGERWSRVFDSVGMRKMSESDVIMSANPKANLAMSPLRDSGSSDGRDSSVPESD